MIAWIAEGLEKVVPQPDLKSKESPPAEPPTEVQQLLQDVLSRLIQICGFNREKQQTCVSLSVLIKGFCVITPDTEVIWIYSISSPAKYH